MWGLEHPWWQYALRAAIVYAALMVLVRLSGKRTLGQFTPFDFLVVLLLSEGVSEAMHAADASVSAGLIVAATLVLLNLGVGWLATRTRAIEDAFDGRPVLIARDGELLVDELRRHRLGLGEWEKSLREADLELHEVRRAFLETDGTISILKKKGPDKPAQAS